MNNFLTLVLKFSNDTFLKIFYSFQFKFIRELHKYDIRINFKKYQSVNNISLLNKKNKTIYTSKVINENVFKTIIEIAKKQNIILRTTKINLKNICGIPENNLSTSHCFNDLTHQTCCLLGSKARKYSMKSGNPIGSLSENIFKEYFNRKPNKYDLTPWCTCVGSKVCSYYASIFNDGTHIKFINSHNNGFIVYDFNSSCESYLVKQLNYPSHLTPGIDNNNIPKNKDCNYSKFYL